eukprot:186501-Pleurochrysis_carterae.AAC.1
MRAEHLTPYLHRRTALPCPTLRTAKLLKPHPSSPALPAPALVVVVHERVTQWGRRPCMYQKVQAQPIPLLSPPQSVPEACSSQRVSETRRSVPDGAGPFAPPPIRTRGSEGGREGRHHPLPYQKVQLLPMFSRSR